MIKGISLLVAVFSLIGLSADALSLEFDENAYDVYYGDVDDDGKSDIYFHGKERVILLHGDIVTPIVLPVRPSLVMYEQSSFSTNCTNSSFINYEYTCNNWETTSNLRGFSAPEELVQPFSEDDIASFDLKLLVNNKHYYVGDFNGDGMQDVILVADSANSRLDAVALLQGTQGDEPLLVAGVQYGTDYLEQHNLFTDNVNIRVADADGDGRDELVVVGTNLIADTAYDISDSGSTSLGEFLPEADNESTTDGEVLPATLVGSTGGQFRVSEGGGATYDVPISLPAGVAGVQPSVSLSYSSQGGGGVMGLGWSVDAGSAIMRCRQTLYQDGDAKPITLGPDDRFCLDGQRLIMVSGTYGANGSVYKTEIDNYAYIEAVNGPTGDPSYFKVIGKDGSLKRYGATEGSSLDIGGKTLTWSLTDVSDSVGNTINYLYDGDENNHRLTEINYANGAAKVTFEYDAADRPDPTSAYIAGVKMRNTKRLSRVDVFNNGNVLRSYQIRYKRLTPANRYSRVESIQECASVGSQCLPALTFNWAEQDLSIDTTADASWEMTPTQSYEQCTGYIPDFQQCINVNYTTKKLVDFKPGDINGDGFMDLVYGYFDEDNSRFYVSYALARSDCDSSPSTCGELEAQPFSGAYETDSLSFNISESNNALRLQLIDVNADGRQDLAVRKNNEGRWIIYLSTPQVDGEGWRLAQGNTLPTDVADFFVDVDSDGLVDLIEDENGTVSVAYLKRSLAADTKSSVYKFNPKQALSGSLKAASAPSCSSAGSTAYLTSTTVTVNTLISGQFLGDFNGDGRGDLVNFSTRRANCALYGSNTQPQVFPSRNGLAVNTLGDNSISFLMSPSEEPKDEKHVMIADLNSDGLSDILYTTKDNKTVFALSTGAGFTAIKEISGLTLDDEDMPVLYDYNRDGYADLLYHQDNGLKGLAWNNVTESFVALEHSEGTRGRNDSLFYMDANGNGVPDRVIVKDARDITKGKTLYTYLDNSQGIHNTIDTIDNGVGNITALNYQRLNEPGDHYARLDVGNNTATKQRCWYENVVTPYVTYPEKVCSSYTVADASDFYQQLNNPWSLPAGSEELQNPVFDINGPMYVVTRVESSAPIAADPHHRSAVTYAYQQAKMQAGGRGFLGFRELSTRDEQTGVVTSTVYKQQFPFQGMPESTATQTSAGHQLSIATNTLANNAPTSAKYYQPYIQESNETTYALRNNGQAEGEALTQVITTSSQDSDGNVLTMTALTKDIGGNLDQEKTTTNIYDTGSYSLHGESYSGKQLGRLQRSTVTGKRGGVTTNQKVAAFTYNTSGLHVGLLKTQTVLPQAGASGTTLLEQQLITETTYDSHGNKAIVKTTGWNGVTSETRQVTHHYDSSGRYPVSSTNGLGQTLETASNFNKYGAPQTLTHANGAVVTIDYDELGREIGRSSNAGGSTTTQYIDCADVNECPNAAQLATYKYSADGAQSMEYSDELGRVIRKGKIGFNGQRIYSDIEYDVLSRVTRISEPYFDGAGPNYWTESKDYDILGRAQTIVAPDGSTSTTEYNGLSTISTNDLLQTRTEIKNGLGELIEVRDHNGGVIKYSYDTEGQMTDATVYPTEGGSINTDIDYDYFGRKISMNDPDKGNWRYKYNAFGELIEQTDAKGQKVVNRYDKLGRIYKRTDYRANNSVANHTRWYFDGSRDTSGTVPNALGHTTAVIMTQNSSQETCASSTAQHCTYATFDSLGRPDLSTVTMRVNNQMETYTSSVAYDTLGRTSQSYDALNGVVSAGGAQNIVSGTQSHYNSYGYLATVTDLQTGNTLESIEAMNAREQVTRSLIGGMTQTQTYNDQTGRIAQQQTDVLGIVGIQEIDYSWDTVGNLLARHNQSRLSNGNKKNIQESFCYDDLNRLVKTAFNLSANCSGANDLAYDSTGNITYKKDVGYYSYGQNAGPHAVTRITSQSNGGGSVLSTLAYDANGNMTLDTASNGFTGGGRSLTYSTFDKPTQIVKGGHTVNFAYGPNRSRYLRIDDSADNSKDQTTRYLGSVERISKADGTVEWKRQLGAAVYTITTDSNNAMIGDVEELYVLKDHLGSTDVIVYADGSVKDSMSFDPWGQRRNTANGSALSASALINFDHSATTRGYTGHEMVDEVGLIHMNGRIYDAKLARFMQADPFIQASTNTQSYNRYSYVLNNPLNATDPSGYFFKKLGKILKPFASIIVGAVLIVATGGFTTGFVASWYGAATIGAVAGAAGAAANGGNILRGALTGAISGAAFSGVGSLFRGAGDLAHLVGASKFFAQSGLHAMVGGVMSVLQGGKFGHGFAAAGLAKGFSLGADNMAGLGDTGQFFAATIAGGTASEITGGKFANGAQTAALAFAVNAAVTNAAEGVKNGAQKGGGAAFVNSLNDDQKELFGKLLDSQGTSRSNVAGALNNYDALAKSLSADQAHLFAQAIGVSPNNLLAPSFGDPSKAVSLEYLNSTIRKPLVSLQYANAWKAGGVAASIVYDPGKAGSSIVSYVSSLRRVQWVGTAYEGYGHINTFRNAWEAME